MANDIPQPFGRSGRLATNADVALWFITKRPGITEADLAELMFGVRDQPRVHQEVDLLENAGLVQRDRSERTLKLFSNINK